MRCQVWESVCVECVCVCVLFSSGCEGIKPTGRISWEPVDWCARTDAQVETHTREHTFTQVFTWVLCYIVFCLSHRLIYYIFFLHFPLQRLFVAVSILPFWAVLSEQRGNVNVFSQMYRSHLTTMWREIRNMILLVRYEEKLCQNIKVVSENNEKLSQIA